jgi:hypothetical protein
MVDVLAGIFVAAFIVVLVLAVAIDGTGRRP